MVVLDPVSMHKGETFLWMKHIKEVSLMHNAMKYCKQHFFPYPEDSMDSWEKEYIDIKRASGSRQELLVPRKI